MKKLNILPLFLLIGLTTTAYPMNRSTGEWEGSPIELDFNELIFGISTVVPKQASTKKTRRQSRRNREIRTIIEKTTNQARANARRCEEEDIRFGLMTETSEKRRLLKKTIIDGKRKQLEAQRKKRSEPILQDNEDHNPRRRHRQRSRY